MEKDFDENTEETLEFGRRAYPEECGKYPQPVDAQRKRVILDKRKGFSWPVLLTSAT